MRAEPALVAAFPAPTAAAAMVYVAVVQSVNGT